MGHACYRSMKGKVQNSQWDTGEGSFLGLDGSQIRRQTVLPWESLLSAVSLEG